MKQKFIARIGAKAWNDPSNFFRDLPLSKVSPRSIKITPKEDDNGTYWTTKVTATLLSNVELLHQPCIIKIRLTTGYYILGTKDLPCRPLVKEGELCEFTLEYKTKNPPRPIKKVLSIAPGCE